MYSSYDYIVVGGGSAGSVVAGRLSEAGKTVLLLEAGGSDRRPDTRVPALTGHTYEHANWRYLAQPDSSRGGTTEAWPAGKILGGSGSINLMVYCRGNRADYDTWSDLGCTGWSYKDVLPHFKQLEQWVGGGSRFRGADGPIHVDWCKHRTIANDAFLDAAREAGLAFNDDYNAESQEGVSNIQLNMKRGLRSSSSRQYLHRHESKKLLTILTGTHVHRVIVQGRKARGVSFTQKGELKQAYATQEVILCAGTLSSPAILMRSGIGPREQLESLGIEVHQDAAGVGQNLQDHIGVMVRWHSSVRNVNDMKLADVISGLCSFARDGSGMLATSVYHQQIIHNSNSSAKAPNLQVGFANYALDQLPLREDGLVRFAPSKQRGVMVRITDLHPSAIGTLRLRSADPDVPPLISHQMFPDLQSTGTLHAGLALVRDVVSRPSLGKILGTMFQAEARCQSRDDWDVFFKRQSTLGAHPVGTCKMGTDPMAVVDPQLRVVGIDKLRIADASVMPLLPSGNTNCPAMMIGEKAAQMILDVAL